MAQQAAMPDETARRDGIRLAEVLAARLCHEFGGPLGTVAAALEIARGDADTAPEAIAHAGEAATAMTARLRLVRAAWAGGVDDLDVAGLHVLCGGLPSQVAVDPDGLATARFLPPAARLVLNVVLLAADCLPRGGRISLGAAGPSATLVVLHGRDAAWPAGFSAWIADPASAWRAASTAGPRTLQGPLTALLAHLAGARLSFAFGRDPEGAPPLLMQVS
jgi:histidine phosphotransferase ChpT